MPTFDEKTADCTVFTFKDGLLSAIAHDLKIKVERFQLTVTAIQAGGEQLASISGSFDATSLKVQTAMKNGVEAPTTLGNDDKQKIEGNIRRDVLDANRHKEIRFTSTSVVRAADGPGSAEAFDVTGNLTLHGATKTIRCPANRRGDRCLATIRINQPDYGIKPYSAMLGTLKVQPQLIVELSIPWPVDGLTLPA